MSTQHHDQDRGKRRTRSLVLVLLAWVFIGGQGLLAAGNVYNYQRADKPTADKPSTDKSSLPWQLMGQGAVKMRAVATQARPDVIGDIAIFLGIANALGVAALLCGLLSWSRSGHTSGKLTIAAAVTVILVNSILNLPYA
jgi:hypothetical protein